jgi:hypothetical protein
MYVLYVQLVSTISRHHQVPGPASLLSRISLRTVISFAFSHSFALFLFPICSLPVLSLFALSLSLSLPTSFLVFLSRVLGYCTRQILQITLPTTYWALRNRTNNHGIPSGSSEEESVSRGQCTSSDNHDK